MAESVRGRGGSPAEHYNVSFGRLRIREGENVWIPSFHDIREKCHKITSPSSESGDSDCHTPAVRRERGRNIIDMILREVKRKRMLVAEGEARQLEKCTVLVGSIGKSVTREQRKILSYLIYVLLLPFLQRSNI